MPQKQKRSDSPVGTLFCAENTALPRRKTTPRERILALLVSCKNGNREDKVSYENRNRNACNQDIAAQFALAHKPLVGANVGLVAAYVGFVFKNRIVYGGRSGGLYIVSGGSIQKLTFPDVEYLYRVSYNPDNPSEWLISGQTKTGGIFSCVCNVFAGTL